MQEKPNSEIREISDVQSYDECRGADILYCVNKQDYLFKYANGGENFEISFRRLDREGAFDISFISEKYGYADFESLNLLSMGNNLKKIVEAINKIKNPVKELHLKYLSYFYTVNQLKVARKYLLEKTGRESLGHSFSSEELEDFVSLVSKDLLNEKPVEEEYVEVYDNLSENRKEKEAEAKQKRSRVFRVLMERIFGKNNTKFEEVEEDLIIRFQ